MMFKLNLYQSYSGDSDPYASTSTVCLFTFFCCTLYYYNSVFQLFAGPSEKSVKKKLCR